MAEHKRVRRDLGERIILMVPPEAVSPLIGKGGALIKEMETQSGAVPKKSNKLVKQKHQNVFQFKL